MENTTKILFEGSMQGCPSIEALKNAYLVWDCSNFMGAAERSHFEEMSPGGNSNTTFAILSIIKDWDQAIHKINKWGPHNFNETCRLFLI